jgi:hypothetical protein
MSTSSSASKCLCAVVMTLITGCTPNIALLLLQDISLSAKGDGTFTEQSKEACHAIADGLKSDDLFAMSFVGSNQYLLPTSPTKINDPELEIRPKCKKEMPTDSVKGTYICPHLKQASDSLRTLSTTLTPVAVIAIQTNEMEEFCPENFKSLATEIKQRKGQMIFVGITNDGYTKFGTKVGVALKDFTNVTFCSDNTRQCVKNAIAKARQ